MWWCLVRSLLCVLITGLLDLLTFYMFINNTVINSFLHGNFFIFTINIITFNKKKHDNIR